MKYVAFLRGVNIVGRNKIEMAALREVCGSIGFKNVKTYINSGNVIFETAKTDNLKLAAKIGKAIEKEFSLSIQVMVRTTEEIEELIKENPFDGQFEREKDLHVLFLNEPLSPEQSTLLLSNNNDNEMFAVRDREILCLLKIDFLESLLGKDYVTKKLKVTNTARNWRTVNKVLEL